MNYKPGRISNCKLVRIINCKLGCMFAYNILYKLMCMVYKIVYRNVYTHTNNNVYIVNILSPLATEAYQISYSIFHSFPLHLPYARNIQVINEHFNNGFVTKMWLLIFEQLQKLYFTNKKSTRLL